MSFRKDLKVHLSFKGITRNFGGDVPTGFLITDPVFEQNVIFDIRLESLLKGRLCIYVAVKSAL